MWTVEWEHVKVLMGHRKHTADYLPMSAIMAMKIDKYSATRFTLPVVRPPLHFDGVFSPAEHLSEWLVSFTHVTHAVNQDKVRSSSFLAKHTSIKSHTHTKVYLAKWRPGPQWARSTRGERPWPWLPRDTRWICHRGHIYKHRNSESAQRK